MKKRIDILINHFDDCLLYVDGRAYNDIGYRDAAGIMILKEVLEGVVDINLIKTNKEQEDFPDVLEPVYDYSI